MTRGLSKEQMALIAVYLLGLALTFLAVALGHWRTAALAGIVTFGLFSALVILTLAAMTHVAGTARQRLTEVHHEVRSARTLRALRRLDDRYARLSKQVAAAEARREAGEQRLLATLEAQRFQFEDDIAALRADTDNR
ncbi:hypothetical protein [Nesterenkonia ebinurensis]|uniref:hypothetical protein n=1 Tax=Nesterenkonia ebinurensis TaxID=2608252 RepID=UPI00123DDFDB|nr:hypothetical protein [Nesterenkonia ebinurensis]